MNLESRMSFKKTKIRTKRILFVFADGFQFTESVQFVINLNDVPMVMLTVCRQRRDAVAVLRVG
jgi:hypothetical protein